MHRFKQLNSLRPSERKPYARFAKPVKRVNNYNRFTSMQQIKRSPLAAFALFIGVGTGLR